MSSMLPSIFNQIFRHGIDISRHHFKGVYICTIGKNRNQSSKPPEVICTLHEGSDVIKVGEVDPSETATKHGPITLSYQGLHATLRPWEPTSCVIAAGIYNLLVHFPIKPGSRVFALDCSLRTLSHLADIVGESGRLIAVISQCHPEQPTQEELAQFPKMHPGVSVIQADIQNASLETYERLLSIPQSSRYAFLMAMHPRLGESSPARRLAVYAQRLCQRIFSFLECGDAAHVKCLVVGHCPEGIRVESIREVVLSHIDILQRWRTPESLERINEDSTGDVGTTSMGPGEEDSDEGEKREERECREDEGSSDACKKGSNGRSSLSRSAKEKKERRSNKIPAPELTPQWVLLDLPTDCIVTPDNGDVATPAITRKLNEVVECMKKMKGGARTGLLAKEQLPLKPYFNNHVLLLLKYVAHQDERRRKIKPPPGLESDSESARPRNKPSTGRMPLPTFLSATGLAPPNMSNGRSGRSPSAPSGPDSVAPTRPRGEQPGPRAGSPNRSSGPVTGAAPAPAAVGGNWSRQRERQGLAPPSQGSDRIPSDAEYAQVSRANASGSSRAVSFGSGPMPGGGGSHAGGHGGESGAMMGRSPYGGKGYGGQHMRFAPGPDDAWAQKHPGPIAPRSQGLGSGGQGGPGGMIDIAPGAWGQMPHQAMLRQVPPGLWGDGGWGDGGKGGYDLGYDEMQAPVGHMGPGSQAHQQRWPTPMRPMYNNMQYGQPQMPQKGGGKGFSGKSAQKGAPQRSSGGLLGPEHFQQLAAEARAQGGGSSNDLQYMAFSL